MKGATYPLGHADFSPCRRYRYTLWRWWDSSKPFVMFIGLNPSTADEVQNDPTVTRCINYARSWGYGGMCMTNIFAYRATDPREMKAQPEPVGTENDRWLQAVADQASLVIAAWGTHGAYRDRAQDVIRLLLVNGVQPKTLKHTKDGHPSHPLYLRADLKPIPLEVHLS